MRSLLLVIFMSCAAFVFARPVLAQEEIGVDVIPPSGEWVTDQADMLTSAEEQALSRKLAAYADTTSTQIVVVTLPGLDGVPIAMYAVELGRAWGVGQEGQDNGVVILVSEGDREVFIATGYGLGGSIPDAIAARIVRNVIRPAFRQKHFYTGLSQATDALIAAARGEFEATPAARDVEDGGVDVATLYALLIIAFFVISGLRKGRGGGGNSGGQRFRRGRGRGGVFPLILWGGGFGGGGHGGGGGGFGGGGFGGFGGGGGSFGGGGAGGGW